MSTLADRGCRVVSATDPRSRYFSIQVAPQLSSRGLVYPVQTHYFSENLIAPEIEPGSAGSVARNFEH
jgi:hypothetical protein